MNPFCPCNLDCDLRCSFEVILSINSYLRDRSYSTHGGGSPTDGLQTWTGVLWNAGFRRKLSWGYALRDPKPDSHSSPGWNTFSPFLVWLSDGRLYWLARDYSQQRKDGTQSSDNLRSRSWTDRRRSWPASDLRRLHE